MFISTTGTKVNESKEKKVFDSRYNTIENNRINNIQIDEKKLRNIIEMYNKRHPVYCEIRSNNDLIYGIPYKRNMNKLSVYVTDEKSLELDLGDVSSISIIRF